MRSIQRIASEDIELNGKTIRKDERLRWFISSANRDPDVFTDPETFDISRHPNPHVAFGSGIHHCLGATLARLEGQEALRMLVGRFSSLELAIPVGDLSYQPSITFRSLKALPVEWSK